MSSVEENEKILNDIIEQFKRFEKSKVLSPKYRKAIESLITENKELKRFEEIENGNLRELRILFKDERIIIIKTNRIITDKETLECFDNERNLWFTFNFNEIIYYTLEKVGENNV